MGDAGGLRLGVCYRSDWNSIMETPARYFSAICAGVLEVYRVYA
jgi:hypothetical protein